MRLESVLELQDRLLREIATPLSAARGAHARALGVPARRTVEVTPMFRGIALGAAPVGDDDFHLAVRVQRRELLTSDAVERITAAARGEVNVRYIGRVRKLSGHPMALRTRPLLVGISVAHRDIAAGTLGCFVRNGDGELEMLSNNHVLADENRASAGDPVLQPGYWDGGELPADVVGHLKRFVPLEPHGTNRLDCATAVLVEEVEYDGASLHGGGMLAPHPLRAETAMVVEKVGRTTGRTQGRLSGLNVSNLAIEYDTADEMRFDGQLEIEDSGGTPFSENGDSGAVIFTHGDNRVIGLLFGGDDRDGAEVGVTYANPILDVFEELGVTLVT